MTQPAAATAAGGGWTPALADYTTFHAHAVTTGDVDPVYPVLRALCQRSHADADAAAWLTLLHVAYYDLGSALIAFAATGGRPAPPGEAIVRLPCGTERRGHRDYRKLTKHLAAVYARADPYGGAYTWLRQITADTSGAPSYRHGFAALQQVHGFGRWAAYKLCELAANVLAPYDPAWRGLEPADMGHAYSSGPRHGLALLTDVPDGNGPAAVAALDAVSARLVEHLRAAGLPASAATAETTLCDFHALHTGRYYVGHDIDQMARQLHRAQAVAATPVWAGVDTRPVLDAAWQARADTLPGPYLCELEDPPRYTVDLPRRRAYADTGVILTRGAPL